MVALAAMGAVLSGEMFDMPTPRRTRNSKEPLKPGDEGYGNLPRSGPRTIAIKKRRKANKAARQSRKINRR